MLQPLQSDTVRNLLFRVWPAEKTRAVILLVHGLGSHSGRWDYLAAFLQGHGMTCYAIELNGFGQTDVLKGHADSFEEYYEALRRLSEIAREKYPTASQFIAGESMGGLIGYLHVKSLPGAFQGLICIAPAFQSTLRFSIGRYLHIFFSLAFNKRKQFLMPFSGQACTRDPAYQDIIKRDLEHNSYATAALLFTVLKAQLYIVWQQRAMDLPILFIVPEADPVVDNTVTRRVFQRLRCADKTLLSYPGMLHVPCVDIGKEKVFGDIARWITQRLKIEDGLCPGNSLTSSG